MTEAQGHAYSDWLERYRQAWIARDADAAGQLFTEDAVYREQPFQDAFVGRAAIEDYWRRVTASQTKVELRYGRAVIEGRRVTVEWWANLETTGGPITLAGEFLLAFADSGTCRDLREYWLLTQDRVEPPCGSRRQSFPQRPRRQTHAGPPASRKLAAGLARYCSTLVLCGLPGMPRRRHST